MNKETRRQLLIYERLLKFSAYAGDMLSNLTRFNSEHCTESEESIFTLSEPDHTLYYDVLVAKAETMGISADKLELLKGFNQDEVRTLLLRSAGAHMCAVLNSEHLLSKEYFLDLKEKVLHGESDLPERLRLRHYSYDQGLQVSTRLDILKKWQQDHDVIADYVSCVKAGKVSYDEDACYLYLSFKHSSASLIAKLKEVYDMACEFHYLSFKQTIEKYELSDEFVENLAKPYREIEDLYDRFNTLDELAEEIIKDYFYAMPEAFINDVLLPYIETA